MIHQVRRAPSRLGQWMRKSPITLNACITPGTAVQRFIWALRPGVRCSPRIVQTGPSALLHKAAALVSKAVGKPHALRPQSAFQRLRPGLVQLVQDRLVRD